MPKKKQKKSRSKSQQRLFGMVSAYKSGKLNLDDLAPSLASKIKSIADGTRKKTGDKRKNTKGVSKKVAKEMAGTKHKGLPETVKETRTLTFEDFINESNDVELKEPMSIEEISKKHGISIEYIESILPQAIDIETEHTDDTDLALDIVLHHLEETPLYYDDKIGLPNMEEELEELDDEEVEEIIEDRMKKRITKFNEFEDK